VSQRGGGIPARAQRSPQGAVSTRLGVARARSAASTRGLSLHETHGGSKEPILDQLLAAHKAYGESLGITVEGQDPNIGLREPLMAFIRYLRAYVVAVTAHTDPDSPTSGALADALLAPLHKWQTYVNVTTTGATGATGATGTTPTTTTTGVTSTNTTAPQAPTNGPREEPIQH